MAAGQTASELPAPDLPFWPEVVDTVQVDAPRADARERIEQGTAFASYVPLGGSVPSSRELGDVLDRIAGIHVHRYGGYGSFATASVRGSGPQQVQILLDGFPIGGASEGVPNLSLLPVANLHHAEVFRGARNVLLPGPTSAGTIALYSPSSLSTPFHLAIGSGSFGTYSARGQWGRQWHAWGFLISGEQRESAGDFPYLDRNGTQHNPDDDVEVHRRNNGFREASWLGKSAIFLRRDLRLDYTALCQVDRRGIPGTESVQTDHVYTARNEVTQQTGLRWHPQLPGRAAEFGRPTMEARVRTGARTDRFENLRGEVGLRRLDEENRTRRQGAEMTLELPCLPTRNRLGALASDGTEDWIPHDELRQASGFTRSRRAQSLVLTGAQEVAVGFSFEGSYRWDHARDNRRDRSCWGRSRARAPPAITDSKARATAFVGRHGPLSPSKPIALASRGIPRSASSSGSPAGRTKPPRCSRKAVSSGMPD
ncbi:MAG: TonB-dependent receptor plug domain-containing protein [Candidatus Eisenbacteria bacterium]